MEVVIPAAIYFLTWYIVAQVLWEYGFTALEQTDLSDSVPSAVMSLFKYSLYILMCYSSLYAIVFPPVIQRCMYILASLVSALRIGISSISSYKSFPVWGRVVYSAIVSLALLFCRRFKAVPSNGIRWEALHIVYTDNDIEINDPSFEGMDGVHYEAYPCLYLTRLLPHIFLKYSFPKFVDNAIFNTLDLFGLSSFSYLLNLKVDLSLASAPMVSILTYAFWTMITKDEGAVKTVAEYKIHSVWRNNRRKVSQMIWGFLIFCLGMWWWAAQLAGMHLVEIHGLLMLLLLHSMVYASCWSLCP